eukprot:g11926.t1
MSWLGALLARLQLRFEEETAHEAAHSGEILEQYHALCREMLGTQNHQHPPGHQPLPPPPKGFALFRRLIAVEEARLLSTSAGGRKFLSAKLLGTLFFYWRLER